jgi:hypothetical protein
MRLGNYDDEGAPRACVLPRFLRDGEILEVAIGGRARLRNPVTAASDVS